ncbi:MAG: site-specific integrase [Balneolaceae bacterium]
MPATYIFFLREDRSNKRGLCPIVLKITQDRKRKYSSTGIRIKPKDWNDNRQEVRKGHPNYNKLNQELDIIRENAAQAYRELNREKRASAEAIKKRMEYSSKDDFFNLADEYLEGIRDQFYTWKQSRVAVNKVKGYYNSAELPINLIDANFLTGLVEYMRTKLGNKASTIRKNIGAIRNILDIAVRQHLIPENPTESSHFQLPKKTSTSRKAKLSYRKIQEIENLNLEEGSNLWHSRNVFILSFYFCGIRFGDLAMLTWGNVRDGRLKYVMGKTGNEVDFKIPDGAYRYLDLYDNCGKEPSEYILPFLRSLTDEQRKSPSVTRKKVNMWNVVINGERNDENKKLTGLKKIASLVGVNEILSMHVARHSFAQYVVEEKNIPVYRLMVLLGHQNVKTTMEYLKTISVKAADETIDEIF